ncbi:MAG: epoxide hydrolase, partial [Sphingobacterium siyangense]
MKTKITTILMVATCALCIPTITIAQRTIAKTGSVNAETGVRPYKINIPQVKLDELKRRISETRFPDSETVNDESQGIQLAQLKELINYWGNGYDWRKLENKLNALPQFVTKIDGLDIQFIHVRSKEKGALPLILTHGWPGSPLEFIDAIGPLTDPVKYGGKAEDAFDVIIPAIPGYGFS